MLHAIHNEITAEQGYHYKYTLKHSEQPTALIIYESPLEIVLNTHLMEAYFSLHHYLLWF